MKDRHEQLYRQLLAQEIVHHSTPDKLYFLDMGIKQQFAEQDLAQLLELTPSPAPVQGHLYPQLGVIPAIDCSALNWLHPSITEVCLCVGRSHQGEIYCQWYGRSPLVNVQMWSATKIVPMLAVTCTASALAPNSSVDQWQIDSYSFKQICDRIVDYQDQAVLTSNAIAGMLKQFFCPAALEHWLQRLTGNQELKFTGLYGEPPLQTQPTLCLDQAHKLTLNWAKISHALGVGQNLVSAYDLTRTLSVVAWQKYLDIDNPQHLCPLIHALAKDPARYVDMANLPPRVTLSKMGFGYSDERQRYEIAYTVYSRLAEDLAICLTLRGHDADALAIDALVATVVIEIIDWVRCKPSN